MSYQEHELSLSPLSDSNHQGDKEVLVTGIKWSRDTSNGHLSLLIISYMYHGIQYVKSLYIS